MRMEHDGFELRGTYVYASVDAVKSALAAARARLEDDELGELEPGWLDAFVRRGTVLSIHSWLPIAADRFLAAEVLQTLARGAVDGVVELSLAGRCIDWFPSHPRD
jgi:hypothetical protein